VKSRNWEQRARVESEEHELGIMSIGTRRKNQKKSKNEK
jgi:hypothetical protein